MTASRTFSSLFTIALVAIALPFSGCSKKPTADEGASPINAPATEDNALGDSDSGKAGGLQTIHFGYDSFVLDSANKETLKGNAQVMKDKASVKIQIEGHCDQRGGIQYNIALGEKRANAVRKFMMDLGVSGDRLTTISYGKERTVDSRETEEAYSKNRRANFAITAR